MSATATAESTAVHGAEGHAGAPDGGGHGGAREGGPGGGGHGDGHGGGGGHGHGRKHHAPAGSSGPGAPLWMLSFADMMTNLLCFFILMSAFASVQQGIQFEDWLGSIRSELSNGGRTNLLDGHQAAFQFGAGRVIFRAPTPINTKTLVEEDGRILDANRDALREVLVKALESAGRTTLPTPLLFEADSTALTAGHRAFLDELARVLAAGACPVQIAGYAFEEGAGTDDGWNIAEARARGVRDHLVAAGLDPGRLSAVGFGLLRFGADTRYEAGDLPQNRYGRRAVLITLLEEP